MSLAEVLRLAVESLLANRLRTGLTMLGMVIGVLAVVLLVSVGSGAKNYVLKEFEGLGSNLIVIQPGRTDAKGQFGPPIGISAKKLTLSDVAALEKRALNLDAVTGLCLGTASARYEEQISYVSVFGTNEQFIRILNVTIAEGDFYSREEDDYGRRVAVLGPKVAENLFGLASPVGRRIKLNGSEFRVIGVTVSTGQKLGFNLDEFIFVPTRSALRLFNEDKLFGIRAKARSRSNIDDAVEEIKAILKERRQGEEDFTIVTQGAIMESMNTILSMLTYVLACIAAISMLVGGIGIMNIMLVSVSERIPEIGIRRAVGARRRDILFQFLAEAVTLSVSAGLLGLSIALAITYGVYWYLPSFDLRAPTWILIPAFLLSFAVGVVFGVWPARRAAYIETLDALRHE